MDKPGSSMPKELPGPSEHTPCGTSKDKSNTTAPVASHDTKDTGNTSGSGSRCSSEKDSGYSESSDWQQTDAEDQQRSKSPSRGSERIETSQSGQTQANGQGTPGISSLIPAQPNLPTVYILKNMLKQPDATQKKEPLLWKNKNSSATPHMILCQQPILLPTNLQPHKSLSRKLGVTGRKTNGAYFPIFNSYPRIAPHPSKKPPDKSSVNDDPQNMNKRVFTEHKTDGPRSPAEQHFLKQPKLAAAAVSSGQPYSSTTRGAVSSDASSMQSSLSASTVSNSSSVLATRGLFKNSTNTTRHRRFVNTLEILKQSGLLDLTLRTKELLRQSNAIDQDIAQLRQHTQILCQVANKHNRNKDNIMSWETLHTTMAESSNYPDLKDLQEFQSPSHPNSTGHLDNRPLSTEGPNVTPSPLLNTSLASNQDFCGSQQPQSEPSQDFEAMELSADDSAG